jgi:hypothetical protein
MMAKEMDSSSESYYDQAERLMKRDILLDEVLAPEKHMEKITTFIKREATRDKEKSCSTCANNRVCKTLKTKTHGSASIGGEAEYLEKYTCRKWKDPALVNKNKKGKQNNKALLKSFMKMR